ncbi:MAG: hypothetical protein ACLQBD_18425 [Syntrophobacteraceae bacterium]
MPPEGAGATEGANSTNQNLGEQTGAQEQVGSTGGAAGGEQHQEERSFTPVEELAMEIGWNPDFQGENVVDAATYIRRSREIQGKQTELIKDLRRETADNTRALKSVRAHFERVNAVETTRLQKQIENLQAERDQAIDDADKGRVHELDKQIRETEQLKSQPIETNTSEQVNPDFEDWHKDNPWYLQDQEMTLYADGLLEDPKFRKLPAKRLYKAIEKTVKEMFPDKFENAAGGNAGGANGGTNGQQRPKGAPGPEGVRPRQSRGLTVADLTPEERDNMSYFVRKGVMTQEAYIADIAKLRSSGI